MADWEEVKRLAADFQKVQLSSSTQKLSERNCIEIVTMLIEKKLLDLIFTSDGKEYLTPSHLVSEIISELYVSGGRVNLADLAKIIGIDLAHIMTHLNEVVKIQKDVICVLGQLIDANYLMRIAGEINEKLAQTGQINVSDLTMQYDLPADFIQAHILEKNLGKQIFGKQDKNDPRLIFTECFIERTRAKIRGALVGLTRPVPVAAILTQVEISEMLFFSLFDEASMFGCVTSRMAGAQYIPNVHARSQSEWVHDFYKQNGYLEYDALVRLGVCDYRTYLKKSSLSGIQHLSSCVIGNALLERIAADIEECIASKSHMDLHANMPSVFNDEDIQLVLEKVLMPIKQKETLVLDGHLLSKSFVESLSADCQGMLEEAAKQIVESGKYQQHQTSLQVSSHVRAKGDDEEVFKMDKREERRKRAAGGKSGGGTQGRETKTRSTKCKKLRQVAAYTDEDWAKDKAALEVISPQDIIESIQIALDAEGLDVILEAVAEYLHPSLNEKAMEIAAQIYQTTVADRTAIRRQAHSDVQTKLNLLFVDIRLFEKGIKLVTADVQSVFYKYLLKSQCTEFANIILNHISSEEGSNAIVDHFNSDQRLKFAGELRADYKAPLVALTKALSAPNVDDFFAAVEAALHTCSMILKKYDKKKDRVAVLNHKHALLEQLEKSLEPPIVLHLATLIIFVTATQCMVHASGRHVVHLLAYLRQFMAPEHHREFTDYYEMVGVVLSGGCDRETAQDRLSEKMPVIKQIAIDFKKLTTDKS